MDFKELERTWQNQRVTGGNEPATSVVARMKQEVAIARRRIRGGIVLAGFVLFVGWTVSITAHLTSIKPFTALALFADAVNVLFLVAFLIRASRSARAVQSEMKWMGGTLVESLSAARRTIDLQIANARIAAYAIPIVVAINAWLLIAKYLAGDLPGAGATIGAAGMGAFGAVIAAIVWHRRRTHLIPRREELTETLRTLESNV